MDYNRRSMGSRMNHLESPRQMYSNNYNNPYNQKCFQGPTIKVINSDTGDSGELYHCKCGQDIYASARQNKPAASPPVDVVTYQQQIGRDKMLVVKQEVQPSVITPWVAFHAVMFIFFFILLLILLQQVSFSTSKADEIMAVLALLLFIQIYFQPPYFIPSLMLQLGTHCDKYRTQ